MHENMQTEDETFKVLRRKISYEEMRSIIKVIRWLYNLEPYHVTDYHVKAALKEQGWDYVDYYMVAHCDRNIRG